MDCLQRYIFEVLEQRWPGIPTHRSRGFDNVVASQSAHRNQFNAVKPQAAGQLEILSTYVLEDVLVIVNQIHLVDSGYHVRDAQETRDEGVPPGLGQQ